MMEQDSINQRRKEREQKLCGGFTHLQEKSLQEKSR